MATRRTPGAIGVDGHSSSIDEGTLARTLTPIPGVIALAATSSTSKKVEKIDEDIRMLAATAYGESSTKNVFEEMAAIANVLVRQQKARSHQSISAFIKADKTFAFAAHDGNARYSKLFKASDKTLAEDQGMALAIKAARNALSATSTDYSNGAYFWDGADIKSNYDNHPKVKGGIHFTDASHNIYKIKEKDVPGEGWWLDKKGKPTSSRGKWNYKYESTAAYGGSVFWKYNANFLKATGNKAHN